MTLITKESYNVQLKDLPEGSLFKFNNTIALKTEYQDGAIEAYIVGTGERFWGGTHSPKELGNLLVQSLEVDQEHEPEWTPPQNARRAIWTDPCIFNGNPKYKGWAWPYKPFGTSRGWERMNYGFRPDDCPEIGKIWVCEDDLIFEDVSEKQFD